MKKCTRCGSVLPISEFGIDKRQKDGHNIYCKECLRQLSQIRRAKKAENKKHEMLKVAIVDTPKVNFENVSSRELLAELKSRGYYWTDMYVNEPKKVDFNKI